MATPRIISSEGQGSMTPQTIHAAKGVRVLGGATPRQLNGRHPSPWANIQNMERDDTFVQHERESTGIVAEYANIEGDNNDHNMSDDYDHGSGYTNDVNSNNNNIDNENGDQVVQHDNMHEGTLTQHRIDALHDTARDQTSSNQQDHVGLSERYTRDLEHWQRQSDLPERRMMVQRIIAMTRSKILESSNSNRIRSDSHDRAPSLAKRIELSLYSRAASFEEYRDLNTLRRRLQSLVALSFHEAAASKISDLSKKCMNTTDKRQFSGLGRVQTQTCKASSSQLDGIISVAGQLSGRTDTIPLRPSQGKRKYNTKYGVSKLCIKRVRLNSDIMHRGSFFALGDDKLALLFSYLTGTETVKCTGLNRYASATVPKYVKSLTLEANQLQRAFHDTNNIFLYRYPNIEILHVFNQRRICDRGESGLPLHAWGCNEHDLSHDQNGEHVIIQLAQSLRMGACRRLKTLRLVSVFNNTCRYNALHALCSALSKGCCKELEHLLLGGNGISDIGTVDIAWLLAEGTLSRLVRLDIRRNYIGEAGVKRLMNALLQGKCRQLKYLCVGGNIITDNCVDPIVRVLSSSSCPQMRFLGLEDNFLSTQGVNVIIQAAIAGGMMPKLHHVGSEAERTA